MACACARLVSVAVAALLARSSPRAKAPPPQKPGRDLHLYSTIPLWGPPPTVRGADFRHHAAGSSNYPVGMIQNFLKLVTWLSQVTETLHWDLFGVCKDQAGDRAPVGGWSGDCRGVTAPGLWVRRPAHSLALKPPLRRAASFLPTMLWWV